MKISLKHYGDIDNYYLLTFNDKEIRMEEKDISYLITLLDIVNRNSKTVSFIEVDSNNEKV